MRLPGYYENATKERRCLLTLIEQGGRWPSDPVVSVAFCRVVSKLVGSRFNLTVRDRVSGTTLVIGFSEKETAAIRDHFNVTDADLEAHRARRRSVG